MKRRETALARLIIVLAIVMTLNGIALAQSTSDENTLQAPMTEKKTKTTKIHDYTTDRQLLLATREKKSGSDKAPGS